MADITAKDVLALIAVTIGLGVGVGIGLGIVRLVWWLTL